MTDKDQACHFSKEIDAVILRFSQEYELSSAAAVGVLMMKIRMIQDQSIRQAKEDDTPRE